MSKLYATVVTEKDGKRWAWVLAFTSNDNALCIFQRVKGITSANIYTTKKQACEVAAFWNECYKNNGTNLY